MRVFRLFRRRHREIRPSQEEMNRARMIMSRLSTSKEFDVAERAVKLKSIAEVHIHGERND